MCFNLKIRIVVSGILVFTTTSLFSQYFTTGQDPASIKWRQINTQFFRLVYDSCYEAQAQRLAAIFEYCDTLAGKTLSQKPEKISIIIHNHSALSNGLVVWAPKRMEIFPVSPQDIYPQGWFEQLGLHEWRHVAQISRIRRGFTSITSILFGQQALGSTTGFIHSWFLEGDAVTTETALSLTGRGREPSFEMESRALVMEKNKPFIFKKAMFGSFNHHVPDYYQLGYLMVAYNRAKYGTQLWEDLLDFSGKRPFTLFPFYFSLKQSTGLSRTKLYRTTFCELDSAWNSNAREIEYSKIETINRRTSDVYTSYRNPCFYNDSSLIVEKSGIDDIKKFVMMDLKKGNEQIIYIPGMSYSDNLSLAGRYLVWAEIVPDIRWENSSYSIIKKLDIKTGKVKNLSKKSKYYAPAISPDSKIIATVEANIKGENSIVLLTAEKGEVINKFPTPGNNAVQLPSWDDSSRYLVMTSVEKKGKSLLILDTKSGLWQTIMAPSFINISQPRFFGEYIIYRSGLSGIENLYAIQIMNRKIFQITSAHFGAFDPIPGANRQSIYFSDYTSQGYDIASINADTGSWIPLENVKNISLNLAEKISSQEPEKFDPDKIQNKRYVSKPYSKIANLIYVHSWMPIYTSQTILNSLYVPAMPGYMLFSQNLQGTLIAFGGQGLNNKKIYSDISLSYEALYPIFQLSASSGDRLNYVIEPNETNYNITDIRFSAKSFIPFDFSKGKYIQKIIPMIECTYQKRLYEDPVSKQLKTGFLRFGYYLSESRYIKMSDRDIIPRFGESLIVYFSNPPENQKNVSGNYGFMTFSINLPGLFKHNTFKINVAYERQENKTYPILSNLLPSRGFINDSYFDTTNFQKVLITSVDYIFPVIYPDIQFLKFIYIKRIQGGIYVENAKLTAAGRAMDYASTGTELTADYHLFYFPVLINTGIRIAYKPKSKQWVSELVLRVNLNSF
jgi:hypothetical protein